MLFRSASLSPGNATSDGPNWDLALDFSSSRRSDTTSVGSDEKATAESGALELPLDKSFSSAEEKTSLGLDFNLNDSDTARSPAGLSLEM